MTRRRRGRRDQLVAVSASRSRIPDRGAGARLALGARNRPGRRRKFRRQGSRVRRGGSGGARCDRSRSAGALDAGSARASRSAGVHSRGQSYDLELAADQNGRIRAVRGRLLYDAGARSGNHGAGTAVYSSLMLPGPYAFQSYRLEMLAVVTNAPPSAAYRGYGAPEAAFAMEGLIDALAYRVGLDPAEVRRRNLIPRERYPYRSASGLEYDVADPRRATGPCSRAGRGCTSAAIGLASWSGNRDVRSDGWVWPVPRGARRWEFVRWLRDGEGADGWRGAGHALDRDAHTGPRRRDRAGSDCGDRARSESGHGRAHGQLRHGASPV